MEPIKVFIMFTRIVSLILVAAVIACPLSCGVGLCHLNSQCCELEKLGSREDQGLQEDQGLPVVCPSNATRDCCCEKSSNEGQRPPARCPNKSLCQGVCGGAIFENSCQLNGPHESSFPLLRCTETTFLSLLTQCRAVSFEFPLCVRSKNQGRFVRTRHMSFLC
jgi:hypothetical protein